MKSFYEQPKRKTSAEIINEARVAIQESQLKEKSFVSTVVKPVQTHRPFTPRNKERLLFGKKCSTNRPPSAISLRDLQHDSNNIAPPKTLSEINEHIFNIDVKEPIYKIKLPSLDAPSSTLKQKKPASKTFSLGNLPEENDTEDVPRFFRKSYSSPQESTKSDLESPFGRPSKKQAFSSQCILLEPQNLTKILKNREIVRSSDTLFAKSNYFLDNAKTRSAKDVLLELSKENASDYNEVRVINLLNDLLVCLENEKLLDGKINSKLKMQILKSVYEFVESKNEQLLINIAKIILALRVTGNNLSGVCKLVFKISKKDKNDYLFFQKNVLELFLDALGRSSPLEDAEACVYGYGAIKFLTMNAKLLNYILSLGILQLMVLHMKIINSIKLDKKKIPEQTNHALYQLTGALRNVVSEDCIPEEFVSCGAVQQLCETMELFVADLDSISNVSRTLSIISTDDSCCEILIEKKNFHRVLIQLFEKYPGNEEIIVRLTFTLGNILAKNDASRVEFYNEKHSMESLLRLWKIYLDCTLRNYSLKADNGDFKQHEKTTDVMIKIVRVIANMLINPEIGKRMNKSHGNKLTEEFLKVLISNPFKSNEELELSLLSTLNNLSYYFLNDTESKNVFQVNEVNLIEGIKEHFHSKNKECLIESIRILGNLSRSKHTQSMIVSQSDEIFKILINLLDTTDLTLLKTTIGVFINLMSSNKLRIMFQSHGGMKKLIQVLVNYCEHDWFLGNLVCQVLWNYCIDTVDLYELLTDSEIHQLLQLLADYLDEEKLFGISENAEDVDIYVTQEYLIWEEFANVATSLLEKIEYCLEVYELTKDKNNVINSSTNITYSTC